MTDRIPLIVNAGAAQIQELPAGDNISITGNITGNYFIGNGSQLTGISGGGNVDFTAVSSNIIPTGNSVYSLGNAAHQWNDLYLSNATIYMNGTPIGLTAGNVLTVNGNDVITANANGIVNLGNLSVDDNNIYNTNGQGVVISNFSFIAEAETAYVQIPAGNSPSDLSIVQEQGNVRIAANAAAWSFNTDGITILPDNTNMGTIEGANTFGFYNNNANTDFLIELGPTNAWSFNGATGNLTAPGAVIASNLLASNNFVGTSLVTNLNNFNWSEAITNITLGPTTTITLANLVFGDPWTGQVTITGVTGTTQANATWWYEAVDGNQFILYTDSTLSTLVDSSAWTAYVSGGVATTVDYGNIVINGQNVTIRNDHGDYNNRIWQFNVNGQTVFPYQDVARGDNPSGNITGYALVIGDGTGEAIISTPNGNNIYNNSQRLVINPGKGADGTYGEGGDIYLWAGRGGDAGGSGGDIKIRGGQGMNDGGGGYIRVEGGDSQGLGAGGYITLIGGTSTSSTGGYVQIQSGQGVAGANIDFTGGTGTAGPGGNINITGGVSANGLAEYGNIFINAGASQWNFDNTGALRLPGGTGYMSSSANTITIYSDAAETNGLLFYDGGGEFYASGDFAIFADNANNGNIWRFYANAVLSLPGEGIIQNIGDTVILQSKDPGTGNVFSARLGTNGGLYFETTEYPNGWLSLTNSSGDANISSPGGSINIDAANGTSGAAGKNINITAGDADQGAYYTTAGGEVSIQGGMGAFNDGGGGGPGGNVNLVAGTSADPAGHTGNINITSGTHSWTFDYSGGFTAPGNITAPGLLIDTVTGITANAGNVNINQITGLGGYLNATGGVFTGTVSVTGNITAGNFVGTGSNVELVANTYTATFDTTGNLTVPTNVNASGLLIDTVTGITANAGNININQITGLGGWLNATGVSVTGNVTGNTGGFAIGYRDIPQVTFSANATAALTDAGKHYYSTTAGNLALTLPDNSNVALPTGSTLTVVVNAAGNVLVNQGTGVSLYMAGSSTTGNRVVGAYGLASVMKVAANTWVISGTGVY